MNADQLLAVYENVSEAPDAIARLRRFVLDLAVRGKLVAQSAREEPAAALVDEIGRQRARSHAGTGKKPKLVEPVPFDGELYDLPRGWSWFPLIDLSDITMGQSPPGSSYNKSGDGVPLINGPVEFTVGPFGKTVVNQYTTQPTNFCEEGDFLVCVRGSTTGRTNVAAFRACIGRGVAAVRSSFDDGFIRLFLWKSREDIIGMGRGIAFPSISKKQLEQLAVPLPPLAEQHRIVAKVDELMALCDRLEEARVTREETRDKLTAATLARLTAPDTTAAGAEPGKVGTGFPSGSATTEGDFPAHARFALETLPALTTRPDQIRTLRQTILNLAVRGKLVEQDPTDEPLPRLDKGLPSGTAEPFDIPEVWQWSRLRSLGTLKGGGTPSKARDDFWNGTIPWVSPKDMKVDYIENAQLSITDSAVAGSAVNLIEPQSVLFVVRGMILAHSFPVAITQVPVAINQDMKAIILKRPEMAEYVLRALKGLTPEMLARVQRSSHGTCRIERSDYGDFPIPLPPLAEQHRIVAKVDALMALCDRLEASLTTADTTRTRLLEALLHEALEPSHDAREAAE